MGNAAIYGGWSRIKTRFYLSNENNDRLKDVSSWIATQGAQVVAETSKGNGMQFVAHTTPFGFDQFTPYRDYIAPEVTITEFDRTGALVETVEQQGLFMVLPPPSSTYTRQSSTQELQAAGPLWRLRQAKLGRPYSLASGQVISTAMKTQCSLVSAPCLIPASSETLPKRKTWPGSATREDVFNDLARWVGYVPAFEDRLGRIRSHIFRKLGSREPARSFNDNNAMVTGNPTRTTDYTNLFNEVEVIGNDPKKTDTPIYTHRLNDDPSSPTSTVSLGTAANPLFLSHEPVEDSNLHSQAACDAAADRIMDDAASALVTMRVSTRAVLDWALDDTIACDLTTIGGDDVAQGIWRVQRLTVNLGKPGLIDWELSKILPWSSLL